MIDQDRGFSFTVAEVRAMVRLQGQYRREMGERLMEQVEEPTHTGQHRNCEKCDKWLEEFTEPMVIHERLMVEREVDAARFAEREIRRLKFRP